MEKHTPVLLLGGAENTLAIARSLSKFGVEVSISSSGHSGVQFSRFCKHHYSATDGQPYPDFWKQLLISDPPFHFEGCVILSCSDEAIEFVAQNRCVLERGYILEENEPELQLALLDKRRTIELAQQAGINAPRFWYKLADDPFFRTIEIQFPALLKPIHSHLYRRVFEYKLLMVSNREELESHLRQVYASDLEVMLTEYIPGSDSHLCSYYTYIDNKGDFLFDYTKSVIRRFPAGFGAGCYHSSLWQPDVADAGRQFFKAIGYRGLGNVEFKRDPRDGTLKLIECNPRFTAAHELLVQSGMLTDRIVYSQLTGKPYDIPDSFKDNERLIYLWQDFNSYRQRRKSGELGFLAWLKSICHSQHLPFFRWSDPLPGFYQAYKIVHSSIQRRFG